jgi:hypothetical protein
MSINMEGVQSCAEGRHVSLDQHPLFHSWVGIQQEDR